VVVIVRCVNEDEMRAGLPASSSYRYADVEGDQLFVAGQVPRDARGDIVGIDDPAVQATVCLDNLRIVLGVHGFTVNDLRQLTVYVVGEHQNLLDAWGATVSWFGGDVPPATLLGVNLLGYAEQLVEVDATVVRRSVS
jgi:enamine deaminase RidA (YjgF/YER057c/UK114 family)